MSEWLLIIPDRLPGMNEYTAAQRANLHVGAELKRKAQKKVAASIEMQLRGLEISRQVRLEYKFVEKNKKRDLDNVSGFAHKVIQDALVETGVLSNDGWANIAGYSDTFECDPSRPHIEVRIKEVE